jgi:3-oxoacyl-[acyl-carrier protein] reductase
MGGGGATTRHGGIEVDLGLKGKVALVTGGSKGIGRACAERLAAEGCDVMIVARTEADLEAAAAAIAEASGQRVETCAADLRSPQGCEAAVGALKHAFGRLDILVNNAGATQSGDFFKLDDSVWEDGFGLKFYACVRLSRALWPLLKDANGAVVNIIGGASKTPNANFMIGGAVNAAITNFTKALAELGLRDGVTVNAVHPGSTVTGRLDTLLNQRAAADNLSREEYEKQELARSGLRRYGQPDDVASLVTYLASPRAEQIHGADLFVDGGATKTIL